VALDFRDAFAQEVLDGCRPCHEVEEVGRAKDVITCGTEVITELVNRGGSLGVCRNQYACSYCRFASTSGRIHANPVP
jgi:hypothetical protein